MKAIRKPALSPELRERIFSAMERGAFTDGLSFLARLQRNDSVLYGELVRTVQPKVPDSVASQLSCEFALSMLFNHLYEDGFARWQHEKRLQWIQKAAAS